MKILLCPICLSKCEDVIMDYDKEKNYYKCPYCKTETWPDNDRMDFMDEQKKMDDYIAQINEQARMAVGGRYTDVKSMVPTRGKGGGSSAGKKRKKPVKLKKNYWLSR